MENSIILEVKTVPAFDSSVLRPLAAFTVLRKCDDSIMLASAWTLKDAVTLFARLYGFERERLHLQRPFKPQHNRSESFL